MTSKPLSLRSCGKLAYPRLRCFTVCNLVRQKDHPPFSFQMPRIFAPKNVKHNFSDSIHEILYPRESKFGLESLCFFEWRILFALVYKVKLTEQKVIDVAGANWLLVRSDRVIVNIGASVPWTQGEDWHSLISKSQR